MFVLWGIPCLDVIVDICMALVDQGFSLSPGACCCCVWVSLVQQVDKLRSYLHIQSISSDGLWCCFDIKLQIIL